MQYKGLTEDEVVQSRQKNGTNTLTKQKNNSFLKIILESLGDPIIRILIIALVIKTIFLFQNSDWYETIGIFIAIFLASLISSLSEYGSEKTFIRMEEENSEEKSKVIRNAHLSLINTSELVVDDIILLETGDKIGADCIVLEGSILVNESNITGESLEKEKSSKKDNKLFKSSTVYSGTCYAKVISVGDKTFYGNIVKEVQEKNPESPLKIRLRDLAKVISRIGYISAFLVSTSYLFKVIVIDNNFKYDLIINTLSNFKLMSSYFIYALTLGVTIIVVSVPEGLPMMVALVLSSNMKRMLKQNVLVRKMNGIETAGSLNILFTDKTGTLTEGKFTVTAFLDGNGTNYEKLELENSSLFEEIKNNLLYNTESEYSNNEIIGGNITDKALLSYIGNHKKTKIIKNKTSFNSEYKYSTVTLNDGITYYKGAREKLLNKCIYYLDLYGNKKIINKDKLIKVVENYEKNGSRIICLCKSLLKTESYVLIGFIVIKDEVRKNVSSIVDEVKKAGINVVMVTGDNKNTAVNIAKEVGILSSNDDIVLTSEELNSLTDEEVKKIIPYLKVVSRLLPQDKSRLIKLSRELNLTVGMTGDGVNDAPALKKADVGFAMGSGTEVCKEASDIIILDNNFSSIASSILFGRTIFKSIRKFIIFQLTVNICAIFLSIIGPFIGIETPVTVIQMLWINMVMDTLAGLAYAYEPPLKEYMEEPPKKKDEKIINHYMASQIFFTGLYTSILCVLFLKLPFIHSLYRIDENDKYLMTAFFGLFIFASIFNSFNARTSRLNLLANINKNKVFIFIILFIVFVQLYLIYFGGSLFRTTGLTFIELDIMILISFTVIPVDLIRKIFLRFIGRKGSV